MHAPVGKVSERAFDVQWFDGYSLRLCLNDGQTDAHGYHSAGYTAMRLRIVQLIPANLCMMLRR